jgi:hypothetical protein
VARVGSRERGGGIAGGGCGRHRASTGRVPSTRPGYQSRAHAAGSDALLKERPGIGDTPLFPSPAKHSVPVDTFLPAKWLRRAEKLAGSLWHAYRRRWATVWKHLPAVDVAAAGGWAGPHTLQTIYQRPDEDTMYEVVTGGGEVREARQ